MKITRVGIHILKKELATAMRISRGGFSVRRHLIVEVETDAGIGGLGEGIGDVGAMRGILENGLIDSVIGLDPRNIAKLRETCLEAQTYFERKGSFFAAFSAIEIACWDIRGKHYGVPVYELLGGMKRDRLESYAGNLYWEEDLESLGEQAEKICGEGFEYLKVHLGVVPPEREKRRIDKLMQVIGPDRKLMVDLNAGYDLIEAKRIAKHWKDYDLFWLEEPLLPEASSNASRLRTFLPFPIASGENEFRIYGFRELLENQAYDILMPDIGRVGGIEETRQICSLANAYGVKVSPHNFGSGVLMAATMHLMASVENTFLLETDRSSNSVYESLLTFDLEFSNGCLIVPSEGVTGLGVALPDEILRSFSASSTDT